MERKRISNECLREELGSLKQLIQNLSRPVLSPESVLTLLSAKQAASLLGVHYRTILRWYRTGFVKGFCRCNRIYFRVSDLLSLFEEVNNEDLLQIPIGKLPTANEILEKYTLKIARQG